MGRELAERPLRIGAGLILAVVVGSGLVAGLSGIDVLEHLPRLPTCLFQALAGLPCPGCGMTRAFLLLGQLRVHEAQVQHPLAPVMLLLTIWIAAGSPGRRWALRVPVARGALVVVLAVWVVRLARAGLGDSPA